MKDDETYNPRDYDPTRPSAMSLALTAMVAAFGTLPPDKQASKDAPTYAAEASTGFLRDAEELANMWETRGAALKFPKSASTWDDKRAALDDVFSSAFIEWTKNHSGETPTTPEDCETFLNNLDDELTKWKPATEGETSTALEAVQRIDPLAIDFLYNTSKIRRSMDDFPTWLVEPFRHRYDLTDAKRKKTKSAQDLAYFEIIPPQERRGDAKLNYKIEDQDPQFCNVVLDAFTSLYAKGVTLVTVLDLARNITGRQDASTIKAAYRNKIAQAVEVLRDTRATLRLPRYAHPFGGTLLDLIDTTVVQGGYTVPAYIITRPPMTSMAKQRIAIPQKYQEIREIPEGDYYHVGGDYPLYPETPQRTKVRQYILQYLIRLNRVKRGVKKYATRIEKATQRKKSPLQAAEAAHRVETQKTKAANLCHIKMEKLYNLASAKSTDEKRRVERDASTILKWTAAKWPELVKGFKVRTTTVKGARGRPQVVKTIDLEL